MDALIEIAIGLEVAVSVVALIIYYSPLRWRYTKVHVEIPHEVLDLKTTDLSIFSLHDTKVEQLIQEVEKSPLPIEQSPKVPSPEFAFKIGNPFELDDNTPGPGVYRLALKSGDSLPKWTENQRPIRVDIEGEMLIYWFSYDGLKRVR